MFNVDLKHKALFCIEVFWGVTLHRRVGFFEMSVDRDQSTV